MKQTRRILIATLTTAAVFGVSACSDGTDGAVNDGPITIGTLRAQPHLATPFFYDEVDEDQDYEIVLFDTSSDIKNAVVSGSVDFGITGAASVIAGVADGQDVRIVASSADGGTRIVANEQVNDVDDLQGTTIGYPMGATQEILLKRTLEAEGLDPANDVELVNLPFSDMAGALSSGQIDAFISAETGPSIAINDGAHELLSSYDTRIGQTNIVLATQNTTIEENPELVQHVVDTQIAATEYIQDHPDEWAQLLVDEFAVDQDVVETSIENIWPRYELDQDYVDTLSAMSEEMLNFGQISNEVDIEDLTDDQFIVASNLS